LYRDLKPENLLIAKNGYLKLADFGFSKIVKERTYTICGTPDYIAPEVLIQKGHNQAADWWSFGVFLFELVCCRTPFLADSPMEMYEKIVRVDYWFPKGFDKKAKSLVSHLLEKDLTKRWGNLNGGVNDIKLHSFFDGINWDKLEW